MTTNHQSILLDHALRYAAAGCRVMPLHTVTDGRCSCRDGAACEHQGKHPRWHPEDLPNGLKSATTDPAIIHRWWERWPDAGIAIVGEKGLDFDNKGHPCADDLRNDWRAIVEAEYPGLADRLLRERTPSKGYHLAWRSSEKERNQKLAQRPPTPEESLRDPSVRAVTLIETRGEGGYLAVAPTPNYELEHGAWDALPEITPDEHRVVLRAARMLDRMPALSRINGEARSQSTAGPKPGDDYNQHVKDYEVLDLLERHSWSYAFTRGENHYLTRPGKDRGVSATLRTTDATFYVFSSNAAPFEPDTAYSPFAVRALLDHSGDFRACAQILHREGYGTGPSTPIVTQAQIDTPAPGSAFIGPTAALANALEAAHYRFQLETESDTYYLNDQRLTDHAEKLVQAAVVDQNLGNLRYFANAVALLAERHKFARIQDRLSGLTWGGQPHIARLATYLHGPPADVIHYADGSQRRVAEAFLRRWLIGAVGRIFDRDQNLVLVLAGAQDIGKSQLARWLGSILPEVYYEGRFDPASKDTMLRLMETFVWEVGELDGVTSRHDAAALKLMLTQEEVIARRPYGRNDIRGPVRASFIGTVNDHDNGFLIDSTGNRRYMVISLTGIDWGYTTLAVEQVWAEAVALYQAGERGRPIEEERAWRDRTNAERHESKGALFDFVNEYFEFTDDYGMGISNADIYGILAAHGVITQVDRRVQMDTTDALKKIGAKKFSEKREGAAIRGWAGIRETTNSIDQRGSNGPPPGCVSCRIAPEDGYNGGSRGL